MRIKKFNLSFGAQLFKSFSDESRLRIISLLYHHEEMSVSDIELNLDFTQTKTARHLTYLKNAGILGTRKVDQWVFYSIKDELYDIIGQLFKYLSKDQVLLKDLETYHVLHSNRELAINKVEGKKNYKN